MSGNILFSRNRLTASSCFSNSKHFWRSFCDSAKMNLHIELKFGEDLHHCIEAIFKAAARALRVACDSDPRALDLIPSSKGRIGA